MKVRYIYGLIDPRYDVIRYVGESSEPWKRVYLPYTEGRPFQSHVATAQHGGSSHKDFWIRGLLEEGEVPKLVILDFGEWTVDEVASREVQFIAMYRDLGENLLNKSGGGERSSFRSMTPELKSKISKATKEAMNRPDVQSKLSAPRTKPAWNKGLRDSAAARNQERKKLSPEERAESYRRRGKKIAARKKAYWKSLSAEERQVIGRNMSEGKKKSSSRH